MQFFFLILINIFMWVIFYLVISLKLEKTASEFREKKLRKIMDDIMREFNTIADRNISLLEKRIAVLKKLMEKSGGYGGIDILCDGDAKSAGEGSTSDPVVGVNSGGHVDLAGPDASLPGADLLEKMKDASKSYLEKAKSLLSKPAGGQEISPSDELKNSKIMKDMTQMSDRNEDAGRQAFADLLHLEVDPLRQPQGDGTKADDTLSGQDRSGPETAAEENIPEEINRMFARTADKYALIKELHGRGYPAEDISRYSGIPLGEITLVLNLRGA